MTLQERCQRIEKILVDCKEGKLDEAVRLIAAEIEAVQKEAFESAAKIVSQHDEKCHETFKEHNCSREILNYLRRLAAEGERGKGK